MEKCTIQVLGKSGDEWYVQEPAILDGIQWRTKRKGEPASLTFTCVKDSLLSFQEGSEVTFRYGDKEVFSGYVFDKHRNKDQHIEVTCYDRTRYFKNKENYVFTGLRADQIITRMAMDLGIRLGSIANTGYAIPKFAQSNTTFWDMIQSALDETTMATGMVYTLYDDFGKLCLKSQTDMYTDYLLDQDVAEDFDYSTSIDSNTYNYIVVKVDGHDPVIRKDDDSIKRFGLLQYDTDSTTIEYARQKADALLKMYNKVSCSLGISGALGDVNVRAGSSIYMDISLGDSYGNLHQSMIVDEVTHTFDNGHHYMDLSLIDGKGFYA